MCSFFYFDIETLTKGIFIDMTELVTKNNHYYPQFLIRNWTNKDGNVCKNFIKTNSKIYVKPKENLFKKSVYDNDTEMQTSKDDNELSVLLKKFINDTVDKTQIIINGRFLQLVFKLFARQPALNKASYNSVKDAILNEPFLNIGVKINEKMFDTKDFKRFVNHAFLSSTDYDISANWVKAKYVFYINNTEILFILPDNTKTLLLPLTPSIIVGISSLTEDKLNVEIKEITDEKQITSLNDKLNKNCDDYFISKP